MALMGSKCEPSWLFRKAPWRNLSRAYRFKHLLLKSA